MDTYKVKTSLMQFEVKNNKLVVITGDTILKYSLKDNGQVAKEGEYQVKSSKYQSISAGFFVDKWNKNEFITLSRDEFCDIDSGIVCIVVGIAVAIAAIY